MELGELRAEVAEFRKLKKSAKGTADRIKKTVPKLTKPGKGRNAGRIRKGDVSGLKKRFNETHHERDAAKLIEKMDIF